MSVINVTSTINVTQNRDCNGDRFVNQMGDDPIFSVRNGAILRDYIIDDNNKSGTGGAINLGGIDSVVEYGTLDNCVRYGMIFSYGALRCTYRHNTILKCQHGISGSAYPQGSWRTGYIQTDCVAESNTISGMSIDGLKLKQLLRARYIDNTIYVTTGSGVYFSGSDSPNKDCLISGNHIFSVNGAGWGALIHQDIPFYGTYDEQQPQMTHSEGNILELNDFHGFTDYTAVIKLTGSNYIIRNNTYPGCTVPRVYQEKLDYGVPGKKPDFPIPFNNGGNDVTSYNLDLRGVAPWTVGKSSHVTYLPSVYASGVYGAPRNLSQQLSVPKTLDV